MPLVSKSFSDIITFSRGSNATYFDSAGVLKYAPNNAIRNNTGVGAVAGTPGTLPTNWTAQNVGGVALTEVVGTGTEDGIPYVDVRYTGTTSSTANGGIIAEQGNVISALPGQMWSSSFFLRIVGGSTANISDIANSIQERDSVGSLLAATNTSVSPTGAPLSTQRFSTTRTLSNASTAFVNPRITITPVSGAAIDITLRIGLPQLEIGNTAGPAIPTSGTAYYGPRFDYNPATLAARGFLVEEQRTNLLLQSEDLSTTWGLGDGTVTANSWTPPTGAATGDTYTIGTIATTPSQNVTVVSSTTYTLSFYYDKTLTTAAFFRLRFGINGGSVSAWFDTANATFGALNAQLSGGAAVDVGNNIYRVSLQIAYGASDGGSRSIGIAGVTANSGTTADTGNDLAIWGAQLEAGSFPTSYIPTTTTALTRAADVASVNTLSPWFNVVEGSFVTEWVVSALGVDNNIASLSDGTTNNRYQNYVTSTNAVLVRTAASGVASNNSNGTAVANAIGKFAFGYGSGTTAASFNGSAVTTTTQALPSSISTLYLGQGAAGGGQKQIWLRRYTFYPRKLSNAEFQAITA